MSNESRPLTLCMHTVHVQLALSGSGMLSAMVCLLIACICEKENLKTRNLPALRHCYPDVGDDDVVMQTMNTTLERSNWNIVHQHDGLC